MYGVCPSHDCYSTGRLWTGIVDFSGSQKPLKPPKPPHGIGVSLRARSVSRVCRPLKREVVRSFTITGTWENWG